MDAAAVPPSALLPVGERLEGTSKAVGTRKHFIFIKHRRPNMGSRPSVSGVLECLDYARRGVTQGYAISLELIGLGYAAETPTPPLAGSCVNRKSKQQPPFGLLVNGSAEATKSDTIMQSERNLRDLLDTRQGAVKHLALALGKSHKIYHYVSGNADIVSIRGKDNSMTILIFGISLSVIKQTAAEISKYREPNIFDSKGINIQKN